MHPGSEYSDEQIRKRYEGFFETGGKETPLDLTDGQIAHFRSKWEDLSEFVRDIKQGFSRFYNRRHNRRGFFWAERFKSVIVDPSASTWIGRPSLPISAITLKIRRGLQLSSAGGRATGTPYSTVLPTSILTRFAQKSLRNLSNTYCKRFQSK